MKILLPILAVFAIGCCTSQKNTSPGRSDASVVANSTPTVTDEEEIKSATPTKTAVLNNPENETPSGSNSKSADADDEFNRTGGDTNLPACVNKLIRKFEKEDVQNPPRKIYSYRYKGKTVYYVTPPCCDFFSDLYDKNCNLIAHPDGGFTGKGDGRASGFVKSRTNEKLIWEDKRKSK